MNWTVDLVLETNINITALANCVDMSAADLKSSQPVGKLSHLAASMFGFDASHHWISLGFYVRLPTEILELINASGLKTHTIDNRSVGHGFVVGTLYEFANFIRLTCSEDAKAQLRFVGNLIYNCLREKYKILTQCDIKMLPDKTFILKH